MKPGIYSNVPAQRYHEDPCDEPSLNYSTAKVLIEKHPRAAYMQHPRLGGVGIVPTKLMDRGNIVHAWLLGQVAEIEAVEADNYKTKAAQTIRDAARDAGKYVILRREHDELLSNLDTMRRHLAEADVVLSGGHCEETFIWLSDGVLCRTRMDFTDSSYCEVIDLKCPESIPIDRMEAHIHDMCYDLQAAVHIDAIETLKPELQGRVRFSDVFIEMEAPYFAVRVDHSESMLEVGRAKWRRAREKWNECISANKWPGYPPRMTAHAKRWAYNQEFGDQI